MNQPYQASPIVRWPDLGLWNLYFLAKFALLWLGLLNFHALLNLLFAVGLLLPLPGRTLRVLRQIVAIPLGTALFYKDTWYPPFRRLFEQTEVLAFTPAYIAELLERFINWNVIGVLCVLVLGYALIAPWLRLSLINVALLAWLFLASSLPALVPMQTTSPTLASGPFTGVQPIATGERPDTDVIDDWLEQFYREQVMQRVEFPERNDAAEPFDLLILNICSLAWDDLEDAGLRDNPLLRRMDVVFDNFNSATSYSGPAAIRVLRSSCGQVRHQDLYEPPREHCLLFDNLARLGFSAELLLNHNGPVTHQYLSTLHAQNLPQPRMSSDDFAPALKAYDGAVIARDLDMLQAWWQQRMTESTPAVSLFYNSITLHDGNRITSPDGGTRRATFKERAETFVNDIDRFIDLLYRSGRRVVVVLVPEHGAAVHGDLMQISGMREIPTRAITHTPVGIKLINMGESPQASPQRVSEPSSYLALTELITRIYADQGTALDWPRLLSDLPRTAAVSENAEAVVVEYGGRSYVRLKGQPQWMPYPPTGR